MELGAAAALLAAISLIAFLVGSIPFGLLIARVLRVPDLRDKGSGNIGATNVTRVLGWKAGVGTLFLDLGKGALSVFLGSPESMAIWSRFEAFSGVEPQLGWAWLAGLFAVLGHCYSPWLRMKGGKGVATGFGVVLLLSPLAAVAGLAGFVIAFGSRRTGSLASLTGLVCAAIAHLVLYPAGSHLWAGAVMIFVILLRHEANIDALLENRERSFR